MGSSHNKTATIKIVKMKPLFLLNTFWHNNEYIYYSKQIIHYKTKWRADKVLLMWTSSALLFTMNTLPCIIMYIYMAHGLTKLKQVYLCGNTVNLYSSDIPSGWAGTEHPQGGN